MAETLNIDTPENVVFGYPVAGIGSRFMAALVDTLVIAVLEGLAYLLMFLILLRDLAGAWPSWLIGIVGFIAFSLLYGYYIFFELVWNGQSLGKRWVGLRVIKSDGMPITLAESLVRNLVRIIDFLPMLYGVGVVVMFIDSQSRRLGDLAAGTLVVLDRGSISLPDLPGSAGVGPRSQPAEPNLAANLPLQLLTSQDILMIQEFFQRRGSLIHSEMLSAQILAGLYKKMNITDRPVEPATASTALAQILAAVRDQASAHEKPS